MLRVMPLSWVSASAANVVIVMAVAAAAIGGLVYFLFAGGYIDAGAGGFATTKPVPAIPGMDALQVVASDGVPGGRYRALGVEDG